MLKHHTQQLPTLADGDGRRVLELAQPELRAGFFVDCPLLAGAGGDFGCYFAGAAVGRHCAGGGSGGDGWWC